MLSAKNYVPLTGKRLTLWKFHKQATRCKAEIWQEIKKGNKLIGFESECGQKHTKENL